MSNLKSFLDAGIISIDPVVTYSKRHPAALVGMAGACPELFLEKPSLHLISTTWALDDGTVRSFKSIFAEVSEKIPLATFIVLATTEIDAYRLSAAGVPSFVANPSIFIDEKIFRPMPPFDGSGYVFGAIYNARMEAYKRHELATRVDNLALVYDCGPDGKLSAKETEVRRLLPGARYLNHELGGGSYLRLNEPQIAQQLNRARCGLCLSAHEGEMRASMEYLLCGLPVVSTRSLGDRDRYFSEPFAIMVPDDQSQVADAVIEIGRRKLNKAAIRDHIGRIVHFERNAFLRALNRIIDERFGVRDLIGTVRPFIETSLYPDPAKPSWQRRFMRAAEALNVRYEQPARVLNPDS